MGMSGRVCLRRGVGAGRGIDKNRCAVLLPKTQGVLELESVVLGKRVELGGRRVIKKKNNKSKQLVDMS